MDSATSDRCSWCHRVLTAGAEAETPPADIEAPASPEPEPEPDEEAVVAPWENAPPVVHPERPVSPPTVAAQGSEAPRDADAPVIPLRRPNRPAPIAPAPRSATGRTPAPGVGQPPRTSTGRPAAPSAAQPAQTPAAPQPAAAAEPAKPERAKPIVAAGAESGSGVLREADTGLAAGKSAPQTENVPRFGTFRAQRSRYYTDQVVDPTSGTQYDTMTGKPTSAPPEPGEMEDEEGVVAGPALLTLVLRYVMVLAVLTVGAAIAAHFWPSQYLTPLLIGEFAAAMLGAAMRAVPFQDDDSDDILYFVILTIVFGPVIGPFIYLVVAYLRQDANPAMVMCFVVSLAMRVGVEAGKGTILQMRLVPWTIPFSLGNILLNSAGFVALAGWYFANVFHKMDE